MKPDAKMRFGRQLPTIPVLIPPTSNCTISTLAPMTNSLPLKLLPPNGVKATRRDWPFD